MVPKIKNKLIFAAKCPIFNPKIVNNLPDRCRFNRLFDKITKPFDAILDCCHHIVFYFPHMKYGKYWFRLHFFIANFHVLGLFITKK
jgi:hypothetical protein